MKRIHAIVTLVFMVLTLGCKKEEQAAYQTETEAKLMLNVPYGDNPLQVMDVYLPPNRTTNTGILIFVHGGSFIGGDKGEFTNHAKYLAASGYAVLNVNYRLVNASGLMETPTKHIESEIKIKDQVADMELIVNYAIAHAKDWVVSNKRVVMVGHSAGASLSLLYAFDDRNTDKVKAVANLAGALDLLFTKLIGWQSYPKYLLEGGFRYTGAEVSVENEQSYKDISPIYVVASSTKKVPVLNVFPQNNDVAGLPKQDIYMFNSFTDKLKEQNIPNEFFYVAGANHNFTQTGKWQIILDKSVDYFNIHVK